jgi:4-hydroxy-tetrahydrodipicolinate reductase
MSALIVIGANGRMGARLVALAPSEGFADTVSVDADGPRLDADLAARAACVVDFSVRAQLAPTAAFAAEHGLPVVIGTTGLDADDHAALDRAAASVPVVWAPNFAVGVNALFALVHEAARMLGDAFDVELVEAHHHRKVDAPSGTARRLAERVAAARGWDLDAVARYGRSGETGPRPPDELGIHVLRGGSVVGEHEARFLGAGETLILEHRATDRDIFVRGALRACRWASAVDRAPGRYDMADVLQGP